MLTHTVIGPDQRGMWFAGYVRSPREVVAACECRTKQQASDEAERLNRQQVIQEERIQRERDLCGFHRISHDLGAI